MLNISFNISFPDLSRYRRKRMPGLKPKYKISIKEYAAIPYQKVMIRTPKDFFILDDNSLKEWKFILKQKNIKDYTIIDLSKLNAKNNATKIEKIVKIKSAIPPRPSRLKK